MGGLIIIIPIIAFDIWLSCTTAKRQVRIWLDAGQWKQLAAAAGIGLALAVFLTFFVKYNWNPRLHVEGFPIPLVFFHLDDGKWSRTILPASLPYIGGAADILTGFIIPFIPYKVAEFLKAVKAELK